MTADRAASVLARLLNRSRSTGENYNLLLSRFVIERLLYRLRAAPSVAPPAAKSTTSVTVFGGDSWAAAGGRRVAASSVRIDCDR